MGGNVQQRRAGTQHRPLTFADVARHVSRNPTPCLVQVRVKGVVLCGRVTEVGSPTSPKEFFKIDCELAEQWVTASNARLCSGDGRCGCERAAPAPAERSEAASGAAAPSPLGNTGVTVVGTP